MKLASLQQGRDGKLVVVSRDLTRAVVAGDIAATLQAALDDWTLLAPGLERRYRELNEGRCADAFDFRPEACASPPHPAD